MKRVALTDWRLTVMGLCDSHVDTMYSTARYYTVPHTVGSMKIVTPHGLYHKSCFCHQKMYSILSWLHTIADKMEFQINEVVPSRTFIPHQISWLSVNVLPNSERLKLKPYFLIIFRQQTNWTFFYNWPSFPQPTKINWWVTRFNLATIAVMELINK